MLKAALLFYVVSVIAIFFGFNGSPAAMEVGRTLLGFSILLVAVNFATTLFSGSNPSL